MRSALVAFALLASPAVLASQIVAMDVVPAGGVKKALAQAVTPVLHSELSRVRGISLITQEDVRAMVTLDAAKATAGCDATGCMADIAGALGAELLLTAQLSRVGRSYHLSLTLIQVEGVKVLRRVTGKASGSEEAASEAIQSAVSQLFAGELPDAARGPGSLSKRAYDVALAGLRSSTLDPKQDGRGSRKRVVLDLIRTELDFDAEPKLLALKYELARGIADFEKRIAMASHGKAVAHLVHCIAIYQEIGRDLERVKEIRTRSRARGVVPSSRPLRFERPDVPTRLNDARAKAYHRAYKSGVKTAKAALRAWQKQQRLAFASNWLEDKQSNALYTYDRERGPEKDKAVQWQLLPLHAMTPYDFKRLVNSWKDDKRLVVMRRATKSGQFHSTDRIYLKKISGRWRVTSW